MKKLWNFINTYVLGMFGKSAINEGGDFIEKSLEKFHVTHPKTAEAMVASMYVWIDTVVEDLAAKTKTPYDDLGVDEAKQELEEFASRHGFELSNLDKGSEND